MPEKYRFRHKLDVDKVYQPEAEIIDPGDDFARLCGTCAKFEELMFSEHREPGVVRFSHYRRFASIVEAASNGCELCRVFEDGYLEAQTSQPVRNPRFDEDYPPVLALGDQEAQIKHNVTDPFHHDAIRTALLRRDEQMTIKHTGFVLNLEMSDFEDFNNLGLHTQSGPSPKSPSARQSSYPDHSNRWYCMAMKIHRGEKIDYLTELPCFLMLCTEPDGLAFRKGGFCGRKMSVPSPLALAKEWYDTCVSSHDCEPLLSSTSVLPTRLVQIIREDSASAPDLKLVTVKDHIRWSALSYRWPAEKLAWSTVKNNIDDRRRGFSSQSLPSDLCDAIEVSWSLGIGYIWIDCLCIVQNDSDDWQRECGKMSAVFGDAAITIAAARVPDRHRGFIRREQSSRPHVKLRFKNVNMVTASSITVHYVPHLVGEKAKLGSALDSRGWTFQERLLSARYLKFDEKQMSWECSGCRATETCHLYPVGPSVPSQWQASRMQLTRKLAGLTPNEIHSWWSFNINEMCQQRNLTYAHDLLPALSGLAKFVSHTTAASGEYLAGIWSGNLAGGLIWGCLVRWNQRGIATTSRSYRGPSWSWARAGLGQVQSTTDNYSRAAHYTHAGQHPLASFIELCSIDIRAAGANQFGQVLENSNITVKAPLKTFHLALLSIREMPRAHDGDCYYIYNTNSTVANVRVAISFDELDDFDDQKKPKHADKDPVTIIRVADISEVFSNGKSDDHAYGLLIKPVTSGQPTTYPCYVRVGLLTTRFDGYFEYPDTGINKVEAVDELFSDAELQTITLV